MVTMTLPQDTGISFDWKEYASCRDVDSSDIFFIEGYGATYNDARSYCSNCVVVVDCLIESLGNEFGMWGCMSPNERVSVEKDMEVGYGLKTSAEVIWQYHRDRGKVSVPSKSIWEWWDA